MIIFIVIMALSLAAQASTTPKVGDTCPTGMYPSGDYCKSYSSRGDTQTVANPAGGRCAVGWYKTGGYCRAYKSHSSDQVVEKIGEKCPIGFYSSGGMCKKT